MSVGAVGLDVGGTMTKLVAMDHSGEVRLRRQFRTPAETRPEPLVAGLIAETLAFRGQAAGAGLDVQGVGVSMPHFCDGDDWVQHAANNMPCLESFPLRPPLVRAFGSSVRIIHDLDAGGLAEYRFGQGRDHERMLLMAVGTGIGTSLVTRDNGLIPYGLWGSSGDTGMIIADPAGEQVCTCGGRGCLETLATAPAIRRLALREVESGTPTALREILEKKGDLDASDVSRAAAAGDATARSVLDHAGVHLGVALTSYLHIFGPDVIVLGGGVARAGSLLLEPIRRTMRRLASPSYLARLKAIEISSLGDDGPAMGAAGLVLFGGAFWGHGIGGVKEGSSS